MRYPLYTARAALLCPVAVFAHTPLCSCYDMGDGSVLCEGGFSDGFSAAGVALYINTEIDIAGHAFGKETTGPPLPRSSPSPTHSDARSENGPRRALFATPLRLLRQRGRAPQQRYADNNDAGRQQLLSQALAYDRPDADTSTTGAPLMHRTSLTSAIALFLGANAAHAFDVNDQFSIGGVLAAAGQCQDVSARLPSEGFGQPIDGTDPVVYNDDFDSFDNQCRGGMPVQIEFDYHPTDNDQFFVALGWAVDNSLNEVSPFRLAPWAANLEDDVEDINGSSRDYLLQAWYRHRFQFQGDNAVAGTLGIIDSTAYLDGNAYANDEYTQFMNEAFVNAGNYNLPSYDAGIAVEAEFGRAFSFNAVGMNINKNSDGNNFNFWGAQIGWHPEFGFGAGNYRLSIAGTSSEFSAPSSYVEPDSGSEADLVMVDGQELVEVAGESEALLGWGLSFDQAISESFGLFLRLSWQDTVAAVDYEALYSGGINVTGNAWKRPDDNIGLGYAYLVGGNTDVNNTNVFEAYYRASINDYFAVTADLQYMEDDLVKVDPTQENPSGWIFGLRATAMF